VSCRPLHVSQAFHSPLVEPILGAFRQQVQRVSRRAPQLPIASNLTGGWLTAEEATSVDYWVRQARQPVRFAEGLRTLEAGGASVLLEVGPGHSLSALARQQRSAGTVVQPSLPHPQEVAAAKGEGLWPALAGLWLAGVELDWSAGQAGRRRVPLPTYPFERQRFWVEPQPYHVLAAAVRPARKPVAAWGHLPSWKRARPAGGARPQPPQHWIICHNGSPLGTKLAERLRQTDQAVTILDAGDRAGYAAALAAASPDKRPAVLSLWPPSEAPAAWLAQLSDWAELLPEDGPGRLWAITSGAHAIESRDTGDADQALVSGVAARLGCLVRDVCGTDAATIEALLGEWRAADPEPLVALRGRARWVPHWEPLPLSGDSASGLRAGGVYALIGPLRGLGAALAGRLAAEDGARLIILTPADDTEAAAALAALRERGVELWSAPIDLTDSGSIAAGLADGVQQAGALHGVISTLAVPPAAHRDPAVLGRVLGELRAVQAACAPLDLELRLACTAHPLLPGGPEQGLALRLIAAAAETPPMGTAQPWLGICWDGRIDAPDTEPSAATLAPEEVALSLRSTLATLAEGWLVLSPWDMDQAGRRHELPASMEEAAPAAAALQAEDPPRTETERAIAAIWQTLLGIEPIGRSDDFFALGGHSLLATRALTRIRDLLHVELALEQFFAAPTVAALAAAAVQSTAAKQSLIARADRSGPLPPAFSQQRLWFLDQRAPHGTAYTIPAALRLGGQVDLAALEHALGALVERHESLRTTFAVIDGQLAQQIAPPHAPAGLPRLEVVDLRASDAETALARAGALAVEVAQQPFDLAAGPLLRVTLAQIGERDHLLIIAMHHIISDAWSLGIVVRDLAALYQAAATGARAELPALPIQFADYAVWQRASLQGGQLQAELDYWRARLRGTPDLLQLPTDAPRPKTQSGRGAASTFLIDAPLRAALLEHSRAHDATLFMTLLAGLQLLLAYLSGQEDICVGTAVAGRSHVETEALVGFFVNTLPLRTDLTGVPDVPTALARVRETTLGAFAHQQIPFDLLVQELQIPRDSSRNPLFQVALVLQNAPMPTLELPGLVLRPWGLEQATATARFDLLIDLTEQADGIAGVLEYATDLFQSATIERFAGLYRTLLAAVAADAGRSRAELHALLDAADRERQQQAASGIKEERRSRLKQITRKALDAAPQPTSQGETHDVASDH
ncbi:MAG TPA: condensation domain-containing protein, partial [Roseiflexaceae bacterium]|nr:condensation domain-containing protein [Roseiflexaceae bacterium]